MMQARQLYFILLAAFCLTIVGLFGLAFGANKLLGGQATRLSDLRAEGDAALQQQQSLVRDKQDLVKYHDLNTIAQSVVPQDKDQAQAVRQIVNLASASGIAKLSSITLPASTLGNTASGRPSNPNLTQLTPVPGINGVYNLQITITQSASDPVPYKSFINFLSKLEQNRRTAQVTSITVQPDAAKPNNVSFTLVVNEYIKP